jgi:hypothetical protein
MYSLLGDHIGTRMPLHRTAAGPVAAWLVQRTVEAAAAECWNGLCTLCCCSVLTASDVQLDGCHVCLQPAHSAQGKPADCSTRACLHDKQGADVSSTCCTCKNSKLSQSAPMLCRHSVTCPFCCGISPLAWDTATNPHTATVPTHNAVNPKFSHSTQTGHKGLDAGHRTGAYRVGLQRLNTICMHILVSTHDNMT